MNIETSPSSIEDMAPPSLCWKNHLQPARVPRDVKAVPKFSQGTASIPIALAPRGTILRANSHAVDTDPAVEPWLPIQFRIDGVDHGQIEWREPKRLFMHEISQSL